MELIVPNTAAGIRLDRYLADLGSNLDPPISRSKLQRLIKLGNVTLNKKPISKLSEVLRAGDVITVDFEDAQVPDPLAKSPLPENLPLEILYEDKDLIVINKPPGLVVHPAPGNYTNTLVNRLLFHCASNLSAKGGTNRPGIVHRLDKETSGCLVVAKNDSVHHALSKQFAARQTKKIYLTLVRGKPKRASDTIEGYIGRHRVDRKKMVITKEDKGRLAKTSYSTLHGPVRLADGVTGTWLICELHTGRTHQIRVHLQSIGHPIIGDKTYGPASGKLAPRQLLHAWKLSFIHPSSSKTVSFEAPIPIDFLIADPNLASIIS